MEKHIRVHITQGEHGIQWSSDTSGTIYLDVKESNSKRDELKRAVVNRGTLIDLRDIIDRALLEIDAAKAADTKGEAR